MGYNLIRTIDTTLGYCDILEYALLLPVRLHSSVPIDLGLRFMIGLTVKQRQIVLKGELLTGNE